MQPFAGRLFICHIDLPCAVSPTGPLVPSLVDAHWVTRAEAGYLGAFNGLGYIVGCVAALWLPRVTGVRLLMRTSLLLAVIGLGMCFLELRLCVARRGPIVSRLCSRQP